MTKDRNPFIEELKRINARYESTGLDSELRTWEWKGGQPPRNAIIQLVHEYHARLIAHDEAHKKAPSEHEKELRRLENSAKSLYAALPAPLMAGPELLKSWHAVVSNDDQFSGDSLREYCELKRLLGALEKTCDHAVETLSRRNVAKVNRWLRERLVDLFSQEVVLRGEFERLHDERGDFVEKVTTAFGVDAPASPRSYQPSRT